MSIRNTFQRELILEEVKSSSNHPTAEMIYESVRKVCEHISLGTVYRNLNRLSEDGNILKIEIPGAPDRFDKTLYNHYHILCTDCGAFSDLDIPYSTDIDKAATSASGYMIINHSISFRGICPVCKERKEKNGQDSSI